MVTACGTLSYMVNKKIKKIKKIIKIIKLIILNFLSK
jgi:hypothetical protein